MREEIINGYNDFKLQTYFFDDVNNPKGVIQIIHNIKEHSLKYIELAEKFNNEGYILVCCDLRGHGRTALINNLPFGYSSGDIFAETVQDQIILTDILKKKYSLPISIIGIGYGSYIAQKYMIENGFKIKNIILLGSTYINNFSNKLQKLKLMLKSKKSKATKLENYWLKKFNKYYSTPNWLTQDIQYWYNYTQDVLCNNTLTNSFYFSLFRNAKINYKKLENIPYYLPILLLNGTDDITMGKNGLIKLFYTYGKAMKKIYLKTYIGGKNDLLHDMYQGIVFKDMLEFVKTDTLDNIKVSL